MDPLEYALALEAAGVPREQAEVHAKAMTANFAHNVDALVTRDYLDVRFTEFETRIRANMDHRFAAVEIKLARINLLLGIVLAAVAVPVLQAVLVWME